MWAGCCRIGLAMEAGMRGVRIGAAAMVLVVWGAVMTSAEPRQVESPYQGDHPFELGKPLELSVVVAGIRVDTIHIEPLEAVSAGREVQCEIRISGAHTGGRRAELEVALLLEDQRRRALDRVNLAPFRVRSGREFEETQRFRINGAALQQAVAAFVLVEVK
jgi:hypothetical protein